MSFEYLHTMVRVSDLEKSLEFYCGIFGMQEVSRFDHEAGRFTLVFLAAPNDVERANEGQLPKQAPTLELTYNWPDENGETESYSAGRNFGHLAYRVDDIYETCQRLMDKGITINRPPRDGYMAFFKSPDNISIELLQKGEALKLQEPWVSMESIGEW